MGAYNVHDVALFARMNAGTVRRWFFGSNTGSAIMSGKDKERFLTFLDFMQAVAVRNLRMKHRVHLDKIREAIQYAETEFKMSHPFARPHATWLDGKSIAILPPQQEVAVHATGRNKGQHVLKRILEPYLEDVSFNPETGLAESFKAYQFKDRTIKMNPEIHFGQPFVETVGITAERLAAAVDEEGSLDAAAEAFGVHRDDVEAASHYIDSLQQVA